MAWDVNLLPVILVVILNVIIGAYWYSPQGFGSIWTRAHGFDPGHSIAGIMTYAAALGVQLVMTWSIAVLVTHWFVAGIFNGFLFGFWLWLGLVVPTHFSGVIWARKPIIAFVIDVGYYLVAIVIATMILALWR